MGARGPLKKDPKLRQRRNAPEETFKLPTLSEAKEFEVPPLPERPKKRKWAKQVEEWWNAVWRSPMSVMWLDADVKGVLPDLLQLRQFAADAASARELMPLLGAIRKYEALLGLSPLDRLRLRWEIPPEPEAGAGGWRENAPAEPAADPRLALKVSSGGKP